MGEEYAGVMTGAGHSRRRRRDIGADAARTEAGRHDSYLKPSMRRGLSMKPGSRDVRRLFPRLAAIAAFVLVVAYLATAAPHTAVATGISSVTEYPVPGGNPWGTAFDASGRVWVAMPGCDPSPTCSSSTPPGKLALFDPNTSSWIVTVSLPAGYGQPLFVAVDHTGMVWFTMPVTNAIGRYDPVAATVKQWAVPTSGSGPWGLAVDSNDKVWFTEHYVNKIGSFDPASQAFHEV